MQPYITLVTNAFKQRGHSTTKFAPERQKYNRGSGPISHYGWEASTARNNSNACTAFPSICTYAMRIYWRLHLFFPRREFRGRSLEWEREEGCVYWIRDVKFPEVLKPWGNQRFWDPPLGQEIFGKIEIYAVFTDQSNLIQQYHFDNIKCIVQLSI